jgi:glycosyltransferase involved in cell wall biosynthesis
VIAGRNIVCVASSWSEHPTSKHHVMRILSERNHILWVSFHASRRPRLNRSDSRVIIRRLRAAWSGLRRVQPTIDVLSPLLLPLPESPAARRLNARLMSRQIKNALRALPRRPTQLWLFTPDVPELIDRLDAEKVIYYCVDDFAAFDGFNVELVTELERKTVAAADVVIASSQTLYDRRRREHPDTHLVPHGVDFEHFASAGRIPRDRLPADMREIPKPILGYFGLISDYVDLDLIAAAARRRPEWSFVLVGSLRCAADVLDGLGNVYLLGGKPYEELPGYARGFDVGLIPFRMNRLTRAVNPIKLREYLAAGLPVVSSPMPEVLRYSPAVQTAETIEEFIEACSRALAAARAGDPAARRALVREESWRARVEQLSQIVTDARHEHRAVQPWAAGAVCGSRVS